MRRGQQTINLLLQCIGIIISGKEICFLRSGREANEVEAEATQQRVAVSSRGGSSLEVIEPMEHEGVDRIHLPVGLGCVGKGGPLGRNKGPVSFVLGAVQNPVMQQRLIGVAEGTVRFLRRHDFLRIGGVDAFQKLAVGRCFEVDGAGGQGILARIEPEFRLAMFLVRAVTGKAVGGQHRSNFAVKRG